MILVVIVAVIAVDVVGAETPTPTPKLCIDIKLPQVPTRTPAPDDHGGICCFWYEACFWSNSVGTCFWTAIEVNTQNRIQSWETSRNPCRVCNAECKAVNTGCSYLPIIFKNYMP